MSKIKDYATKTSLVNADKLLGTDSTNDSVKNFTLESLKAFIQSTVSVSSKGNMYNTADIVADLENKETWYSLSSVLLVGANLQDFTFSNGVFTYTGITGKDILFNGSANIEVDKSCEITFGLFVNTTLVTGGTTPVDIESQYKKANIGITTIITLATGDTVTVKAQSDEDETELTVDGINTTLWS